MTYELSNTEKEILKGKQINSMVERFYISYKNSKGSLDIEKWLQAYNFFNFTIVDAYTNDGDKTGLNRGSATRIFETYMGLIRVKKESELFFNSVDSVAAVS